MLRARRPIEHYPVLKARIEEHIQETIGQRELLEGCIKRLGGSPSTLKDVMNETPSVRLSAA